MTGDLTRLSAREAAARIADGTLAAEALTRACLERIAAREPVVHAWAHLDPERAIAEARERDRAAPAGKGPLRGVPVGVKDLIDASDMPTGYGSPIYAGHRPRGDAACVALARAAGAVALGKTVTTEFAVFAPGPTANPHNPAHTPGGSSSGSAAAVADFMVPLAFGTQTAASINRPASFCGVVGYKPTFGLVPRSGVKALADSLDTVGVLARDVRDAAFFIAALTERPELVPSDEPAAAPRIGLYRTPEWEKAGSGTVDAVERTAEALRRAGADVVERPAPPGFKRLVEAQTAVMGYEMRRALVWERTAHHDLLSPQLRQVIDEAERIDAAAYDRAQSAAAAARARLADLFGDCDALLAPAAVDEAPRTLDQTGDPLFSRTWTLLGTPSVTVPAWRGATGLPVGIQIVGRPGDDARTLAAAAFVERALMG
jgi:amidase